MGLMSISQMNVASATQVTLGTAAPGASPPAPNVNGPIAVRLDGRSAGLSVINPARWINSGVSTGAVNSATPGAGFVAASPFLRSAAPMTTTVTRASGSSATPSSLAAITSNPAQAPAADRRVATLPPRNAAAPQWMTSALGYFGNVSKSVLPSGNGSPSTVERARGQFERTAREVAPTASGYGGSRNNLMSAVAYFNAATRGLSG